MGRLDERIRYLNFSFLQNILYLLLNISLSFPKFIKRIPHGLFRSKQSLEFTPIYPSLQMKSASPSYTYDLDQYHWSETHDIEKNLVNLPIPKSRLYPFHITIFCPIPKTAIYHFTYLISYLILLQRTTSTFLILMENPRTLQLKKNCKPLSISLTFLK